MIRSLTCSVIVLTALIPNAAFAASLYITGPASVTTGDIVTARVVVDSGGIAINNSDGMLIFPTDLLSVVSVSKSGSIFTLWVEEPAFSNSAGSVTYNGGVPNPGYTGNNGTVLSVTFQAKRAGTATLTLSSAAVRANDGLGTDVLESKIGKSIQITAAPPAVPAESNTRQVAPESSSASSIAPSAIRIESVTHADDFSWYPVHDTKLSWTLPAGVTAVQIGADTDENAKPVVTYSPPIREKTIEGLEDGIWFFTLRYRTQDGWSPISVRRIQIDSVPPIINAHALTYDAEAQEMRVTVSASDERSGIAGYELSIGDHEAIQVTAEEMSTGEYRYAMTEPGEYAVRIQALDRAGNRAYVDDVLTVPQPLRSTTFVRVGSLSFSLMQAFIALLALTLCSLGAALVTWLRLHRYSCHGRSPSERTRIEVHRGFQAYADAISKDLRELRAAQNGRDLSKREEILFKRLVSKLAKLERYVYDEMSKK